MGRAQQELGVVTAGGTGVIAGSEHREAQLGALKALISSRGCSMALCVALRAFAVPNWAGSEAATTFTPLAALTTTALRETPIADAPNLVPATAHCHDPRLAGRAPTTPLAQRFARAFACAPEQMWMRGCAAAVAMVL